MPETPSHRSPSLRPWALRPWALAGLLLLALLTFAAVAVPVWLIRPFSPETPTGLAVAFFLRRWAPLATLAALAVALVLAARLWPGARWWSRAAVALALVPILGATFVSRQNLFEKMFRPPGAVETAPAAAASWVEEKDKVLAVTLHGDAAAYPVRQVAYHHVVMDEVGGVPIAVTY